MSDTTISTSKAPSQPVDDYDDVEESTYPPAAPVDVAQQGAEPVRGRRDR